jgi:hypothetical protein
LELAGQEVIALDLPGDDPEAGLTAYGDLTVAAANGHDDLVVAAQSMGGFTAVPACERLAARRLVLLNAMIPAPRETAGAWWENIGSEQARRADARTGGYPEEFDLQTYFLHDLPPEVLAGARSISATRRTSPSRNHAHSPGGRIYRRPSSRGAGTASSRLLSRTGSRVSASVSKRKRCPAATSPRSASRMR